MTVSRKNLTVIFLLVIFCLTCLPASSGEKAASILSTVNRVEFNRGSKWEQATSGMDLYFGDQLRTLDDSKVMLIFNDGTQTKLDSNTTVTLKKKENQQNQVGIIEMITGAIWSKIRPTEEGKTPVFEVQCPTATCAVRGTEIAMRVSKDSKENFKTTLTVINGEAEFSNQNGKTMVPASCQSHAYSEKSPVEPVKLSKSQIDAEISWIDFGNPRVMVIVSELNLGQATLVSSMESQINSQLSNAHFHLIDSGTIDTIRQTDEAKKAVLGDMVAAATLGKRFTCDVTVAGKVETTFKSEEKAGQTSQFICDAICDVKVIITDTAQLLFSKTITAEGRSLSKDAAGRAALENISKKIAGDLVWEIPLGYTKAQHGRRTTQVIIGNCSFTERDKVIEYLNTIPGLEGKVFPRSFENSIAIIDVEYEGTSEKLVHELIKITSLKLDVTGVTMNRIEAKVLK